MQEKFPDYDHQPELGAIDHFVDEVIEGKYEVGLSAIMSEVAIKLQSAEPKSAVLSWMHAELTKIRSINRQETDMDIVASSLNRLEQYLHRTDKKGGYLGIPTGFKRLDDLTSGFQAGQLIIVLGLAGMGKSYLSTYFATNAWLNGFKPLYISLEMGAEQVGMRFDSLVTKLNPSLIKRAELSPDDVLKYRSHLESLQGRPPFIISSPMNCDQSAVAAKIAEYNPDLCIVDYVSLMRDANGAKDIWARISNITKGLKNIAIDKNVRIPIIAIAQINRGFEMESDELPTIQNVAHSFDMAADADIVLALHQNQEMREHNLMMFGMLKNRDGETISDMRLSWDIPNAIIKEITAEEWELHKKNAPPKPLVSPSTPSSKKGYETQSPFE